MKSAVAVVVLLVACAIRGSSSKGGTKANVGVEAGKGGASVSVGLSHEGKGWSAGVKGTVDSKGNWGVGAGFSLKFGKRSIDFNGLQYVVYIRVDQCDFQVYDTDKDGIVTKSEMHALFGDNTKAEELFHALDVTTGDERIEEDEFYFMSRVVIDGCDSTNKL